MILINRYFEEVTPESAEDGELSDSGMLAENDEVSFRELVKLMRDHWQASCWPPRGDVNEWFSTTFYVTDYRAGTERCKSIHFSRDNLPRAAKYWRLAAKAAGIVK